MAYSNMSQLKMLSDQIDECLFWGGKAIDMAKELGDEEILSHAYNNIGDVQIRIQSSRQKGLETLYQSLDIALRNSYHEHAARAYTNLGHNGLLIKDYVLAKSTLDAGIQYCEERSLDSWTFYMLSSKARLCLETGQWEEARRIADNLLRNADQPSIIKIGALTVLATIMIRTGDHDAMPLLAEAKALAFETMELQRIIPVITVLLEYEWLSGIPVVEKTALDKTILMTEQMGNLYENSWLAFWLLKTKGQHLPLPELYEGYQMNTYASAMQAARTWEKSGCPYEQALALFEGKESDKKRAVAIIHGLGAGVVYEKMKQDMRAAGIKNIPRGIRKSTRSNPALLTGRELDVLQLLKEGLQNKEIASRLFISAKTVDHHISSILFKLDVNSRAKAVQEAVRQTILK